jgi:hypothetical protein
LDECRGLMRCELSRNREGHLHPGQVFKAPDCPLRAKQIIACLVVDLQVGYVHLAAAGQS